MKNYIPLLFIGIFLAFNNQPTSAQCKSIIDVDFNNWNNQRYSIADIKSDFNNKVKPWTASTYRGVSGPGAPSNIIANTPQETRIVDGTLRAQYLKNDAGGYAGGFLFDPYFDGVEEAYLEYKLKFDNNFFWATGGKLPGLGGSIKGINSETEGRGAIPSGRKYDESGSGFSARLMWRRNRAQTTKPYLILYSYFAKDKDGNARKNNQNGDDYRIFSDLKDNKWYTIRQYIKLNTPGKDDGTVKIWIDGDLTYNNTKMNIRQSGKENLKINALIMNTYRGGARTDNVWHSPRTEYTFFDDFKVWTGCSNPPNGGGGTPPAPNKTPTVAILKPAQNMVTVEEGYTLELLADASDSDGTITTTQLYINGIAKRTESNPPYEWGHDTSPEIEELNNLPEGTHEIKVVATDNQGATGEAKFTLIVGKSLAIDRFGNEINTLTAYPNPASSTITLDNIPFATKSIAIYNVVGEKVKTINTSNNSANTIRFEVTDLQSGMYFIQIANKKAASFIIK